MILTCPSCGTRYVVKDGAIPPGGRTVRCAQCKHSWHQDAEPAATDVGGLAEGVPATEPVQHVPEHGHAEADPQPAMSHPMGEPGGNPRTGELGDHGHPDLATGNDPQDAQTLPEPAARPQASALASEDPQATAPGAPPQDEAATMPREAAAAPEPYPEDAVPAEEERPSHPMRMARAESDDLYSPFGPREDEGEEEPRRRWPLVALLVLVAVAAIAAAFWFLAPPELKRNFGLAQAGAGSPLLLQVKQHSRQELASGNQLLEVSGLVINPTEEIQSVPPLQAQLRSLEQKVVYRWTIPPPAPRLAPGERASFNSAKLNIPPAAACLDVFFGNPREPQPPCRDGAAAGAQGA